jgi:hypothetical protein
MPGASYRRRGFAPPAPAPPVVIVPPAPQIIVARRGIPFEEYAEERLQRRRVLLSPTAPRSYSTTFAATENPISESGKWQHLCPYLSTCQTAGGRVYGNQPQFQNGGNYEDGYALLTGTWAANQRAEGTIYKNSPGGYQEVELWLRGSDSSNTVSGYEVYAHQAGEYFTLTIWTGGVLSAPPVFAYFDIPGAGTNGITAPADGDTMWAQIVGNSITAGINGTTYLTFDCTSGGRTPIPSGKPGIGFDSGASGSEGLTSEFGFKDFYATEL